MKKSDMHYAAAIPHRDIPGGFLACYAPAGQKVACFVMDQGRHKLFTSEIEADLAAHRALVDALNRSRMQSVRAATERRNVSHAPPASEADAVFSRFTN
ncbi:hypothetical protein PUR29_34615 [Methylobacterium ajmalii]|uniref:DUF1488 domain-containing protein n=1 Tax=Methylobacterium ajmalii TaxID=2738439 RepID=A0ABV0A5G9_9HYPH